MENWGEPYCINNFFCTALLWKSKTFPQVKKRRKKEKFINRIFVNIPQVLWKTTDKN